MDDIQRITTLLSPGERHSFMRYLDVERVRIGRKDAELFRFITRDKSLHRVQPGNPRNAYHQIRKRVLNRLCQFLAVKDLQQDVTGNAKVSELLAAVRFLMERNETVLAWKFLHKALRHAQRNEQPESIYRVCMCMMDHAGSVPSKTDLKKILRIKLENDKVVRVEENIRLATAFIKHKLNEAKQSGNIRNFEVYMERTLEQFQLTEAILEKPRYLFHFANILRDTYLALRDISHFESFVITQYEKINRGYGFKKQDHGYRLGLLYMAAHALYRNRKYAKALQWTYSLHREMKKYGHVHYAAWEARYVSLYSMIMALTHKNEIAIEQHKHMLENRNVILTPVQRYNMELNLTWFYVNAGNHRAANKILVQQDARLAAMQTAMGMEWMMRRQLMFILNQYELKNEDIALSGIRDLRQRYTELLSQDIYRKVNAFLDTCEKYMQNPFVFSQREKKEIMRRDIEMFSLTREENKTLAYYAWIISKMEGTPYYQTVLTTVSLNSEDA